MGGGSCEEPKMYQIVAFLLTVKREDLKEQGNARSDVVKERNQDF